MREREGGEKGVGVTGVTGVGILNAHCRTTPDGECRIAEVGCAQGTTSRLWVSGDCPHNGDPGGRAEN